jgi:hypothetical protein
MEYQSIKMVVSRLEAIMVQEPETCNYNDVSDYMEEMVNFVDEKLGACQPLKPDKYFAEFKDLLSDSCKNTFGIQ